MVSSSIRETETSVQQRLQLLARENKASWVQDKVGISRAEVACVQLLVKQLNDSEDVKASEDTNNKLPGSRKLPFIS